MKNLINWIGLCILFLTAQAGANEIAVQDVWLRVLSPAQDKVMVGMVVKSEKQARIISVISPAYSSVLIYGPGKDGRKAQEYEFITLPAQRPVVLNADGAHLLLSGSKRQGAVDRIPLIISVQFEDRTQKNYSVVALAEGSKAAAAASGVNPDTQTVPAAPAVAAAPAVISKVEDAENANTPKTAATAKKPAQEKKSAKNVSASKPAPSHALKHVEAALIPAPVAAPVRAPVPAPALAPAVPVAQAAAVVIEPKKPVDNAAAERAKLDQAKAQAECVDLAIELRECEKTNDMMQEWCASNARASSSCTMPLEQLKKLR